MSADIVNLRRVRKAKARAERTRAAEENRRVHGRSKAEKIRQEDEQARQDRHLDGHRRDRD
jgi:hypothetical protein